MKTCILAAALASLATCAHADLTLCNDGPSDRQVAIAYSDAGVWTSEGWWTVPGHDCKVVVAGDLTRQHYYLHAPLNGVFDNGEHPFCVRPRAFTLPGADGNCADLGAEERTFQHIDTGKTAKDFVFTLTDEPAAAAPTDPVAAEATTALDAASASFAPGTHGEPFTVNGLMQNCEGPAEGAFCFFYAEGARWAVAQDGPSNAAAIRDMAALSVNTPILVTGDMISFGDITAEAAISQLQPGQADAWADLRDTMQGTWQSTDDPASVLHIFGSEQISLYDGEQMETAVMTFANACPGGEDIGPVFFTQAMGGDPMDTPCYAILEVTQDRLDLSYVGRGNTLSYLRLEEAGQ